MNDTILVPDPDDSSKKIRVGKLLLQTSVRSLHNDLIRDVPECLSTNGELLLLDTKLRQMMPPKVKK